LVYGAREEATDKIDHLQAARSKGAN
jgi:hypothetical protein